VDVHWTFKGTQLGEIMGIAGTGKMVTTPGTTTLRMAGAKIVEHSGYWDALGMVQQLATIGVGTAQVPIQVKSG
jgi:predicted ester cyclase